MNNIILFDDDQWKGLLPLCYTRPVAELRIGILKIREKWELVLKGKGSFITQDYLAAKFPINISGDNIVINSRFLPTENLIRLINQLEFNDAILLNDVLIAARLNEKQFERLLENKQIEELRGIQLENESNYIKVISRPYDIFSLNESEIKSDYDLITKGRTSQDMPAHVMLSAGNTDNIFVEEGAVINPCFINNTNGPIYIGKDVEIMEGAMLRGAIALCENAQVKMSAKIYGATTIGPHSKVGGEVKNIVIQSNSNKSHDGYLGNAVIGEWCNIGADSNSSNLKNNYTNIKIWDYNTDSFSDTGLQFCGLIMADHSKTGINTMFNTGTVVGVGCNLFGSGFPRNFIPSFSWGGKKGYKTFRLDKAVELAEIVMKRRGQELTVDDREILEYIFHNSASYRHWES